MRDEPGSAIVFSDELNGGPLSLLTWCSCETPVRFFAFPHAERSHGKPRVGVGNYEPMMVDADQIAHLERFVERSRVVAEPVAHRAHLAGVLIDLTSIQIGRASCRGGD